MNELILNDEITILGARYCRIAVTQCFVDTKILSEDSALLSLKGLLDLDDSYSGVDDSHLLNNPEEVSKMKKELLSKIKEVYPKFSEAALDLGILSETMIILNKIEEKI